MCFEVKNRAQGLVTLKLTSIVMRVFCGQHGCGVWPSVNEKTMRMTRDTTKKKPAIDKSLTSFRICIHELR